MVLRGEKNICLLSKVRQLRIWIWLRILTQPLRLKWTIKEFKKISSHRVFSVRNFKNVFFHETCFASFLGLNSLHVFLSSFVYQCSIMEINWNWAILNCNHYKSFFLEKKCSDYWKWKDFDTDKLTVCYAFLFLKP